MKHLLYGLFTIGFVWLISYLGCKDNGVVVPLKNPREFTWTVDTLIAHPDAIQTEMMDIYATSPQNVYVVGITDWSGVNGNGILWRYDGTTWTIIDQGFRGISLSSIVGFGEGDVYAAGGKDTSALILHFDGTSWAQLILPGQGLFTVRGNSRSDIWTGGWMGSLFHFDGAQWSKINVDSELSFKDFAVFDRTTYTIAYRLGNSPPGSIIYYSLSLNGQRWDTLGVYSDSSNVPSNFGLQSLTVIDGELYSAGTTVQTGAGLFKLKSGRWDEVTGNIRVAKVFGISITNIFGVGTNGTVYHYDGFDWYQFEQLRPYQFRLWAGWTDGREVFIVENDGYKTVVLHGK
ncbi:MAG: hypothetical protein ACRDGA_13200 [Bacteroidota bacterium]